MDNLNKLIDEIKKSLETVNMLKLFQLGIDLKVIEDHCWYIDNKTAQRCNDLQHKIFNK